MSEKLRILEVVDNWFPIVDGVVQVVDNYAKNLNKIADCTVMCPKYPDMPVIDDYPIRYVPSMSGGKYGVRLPLPWLDLKLKKFLDEEKFDIIHLHSPVTMAKYILRYAKKRGIPVVTSIHTRYHEEINRSVKTPFLQRFALWFLTSSLKKSDYLWTVAEGVTEYAKSIGVDNPCTVMRNCTDFIPPEKHEEEELRHAVRAKHSLKDDEIVLLTVGRLVVVKRWDVVIDAVKKLKDDGIKVKLLIIGDGDYRPTLEKQVKKLDIQNEVVFAGMVTDRRELASYFLAGDLLLFPSTFDTSGLVTIEAAAVGLPTLIVEGSSSAEAIIDRHNGYLCDGSAEGFAEGVKRVFSDKENYLEVRINAEKELYRSWAGEAPEILREYEEIVADYKSKK